ncbi:MAG: enoyl-CoA hydratase/isomerase family protein [Haloarculaceae archaeon]
MTDVVHLDVTDGRATVTLDDPEVRNALTHDVSTGVVDAFAEVADREVRCVVVESAAGAFSAGGDVGAMVENLSGDTPPAELVDRVVAGPAAAVRAVRTCDVPTVAKLDGPAFGAGAALAIACDVLLASENAKMSFGFRQVGLAVDSGVSHLLPRLVGENVAKELVYTGELVDADRAAEIGLFNRVYDAAAFETETEAVVERIATGPTVALSASKRLLEQGFDSSLDEAIANEATTQAVTMSTDDHREGATAFVEKREPDFEGE